MGTNITAGPRYTDDEGFGEDDIVGINGRVGCVVDSQSEILPRRVGHIGWKERCIQILVYQHYRYSKSYIDGAWRLGSKTYASCRLNIPKMASAEIAPILPTNTKLLATLRTRRSSYSPRLRNPVFILTRLVRDILIY